MRFSDKLTDAMTTVESAKDYFDCQQRILDWPDLRSGQRMAALAIHAHAFHREQFPTPRDLAWLLGIDEGRATSIFDKLEPAPFELMSFDDEPFRFTPSHQLAYGTPE